MKKLKCKKCESILEFPQVGETLCKCGNITLNAHERVIICNSGEPSFCTLDDAGNEVLRAIDDIPKPKPNKHELLKMIKDMRENFEKLPSHALSTPVTHYDFIGILLLLESLFAED